VAPNAYDQIVRAVDPDLRNRVTADSEIEAGVVIRTPHVEIDSTLRSILAGVDAAVESWLAGQPWTQGWGMADDRADR
jgi:flagellar biosynthesis/type III secretory pathway protein FliH